jgi:predicted DNA binding protein
MGSIKDSSYIRIKIIGTHDNCWSSNLDFNIKLVNFQIIGGYVRSTLFVPKYKRRNTLKLLRDYYKVFVINAYQDFSSGSLITITKNLRNTSILNILYNYSVIFLNNQYLSNGKEIWEFVVSREMYDEVIKKWRSN